MTHALPPIAKLAEQLQDEIERAVRRFAQYHRNTFGIELRREAMEIVLLTHRAWRERSRAAQWVHDLVWAIDALKLRLQLACRQRAFVSLGQFEALYRVALDLGRQAGGWHRQLSPRGQNAPAPNGRAAARQDTEYSRHPMRGHT